MAINIVFVDGGWNNLILVGPRKTRQALGRMFERIQVTLQALNYLHTYMIYNIYILLGYLSFKAQEIKVAQKLSNAFHLVFHLKQLSILKVQMTPLNESSLSYRTRSTQVPTHSTNFKLSLKRQTTASNFLTEPTFLAFN